MPLPINMITITGAILPSEEMIQADFPEMARARSPRGPTRGGSGRLECTLPAHVGQLLLKLVGNGLAQFAEGRVWEPRSAAKPTYLREC